MTLLRVSLLVTVVLSMLACAPDGYTVVRGAAESGAPQEIIREETTERVYNCGAGGDVIKKTPHTALALAEAVQWEFGLELGAERNLALVTLNGELEGKYGVNYEESRQIGTGWELPAQPGEWIEYTIRWSELWQPGTVIVRRGDVEETVAYRYRKAIQSEIVGKRLLDCAADVVEVAPTPAAPPAMPAAETQAVTATGAPLVQIVGYGYPPDTLTNAGQRRAAALLAAELDAKRKLAEWLTGAEIEAVTVVEAGEVSTDVIRRVIQTHLRGVMIVRQAYDEKSGEAEVMLAPVVDEIAP